MAITSFTSVRPGDVISSDLMNFLLVKLAEMEVRINDLEQGGSTSGDMTITGFDPPNQVSAGQELGILGTNLPWPPDAAGNIVTIDGAPITVFRQSSTPTALRFIVPANLSIPAGGKSVTIFVHDSQGRERTVLYRVLPPVVVIGNPPTITNVAPVSGDFRFVQQFVLITGTNFAANPQDNIIRFRVTSQTGAEIVYPFPGATIEINAANTNTTQIECRVPDIAEIPAGQSRQVTVEVGVGAHVPAQMTVSIRRP